MTRLTATLVVVTAACYFGIGHAQSRESPRNDLPQPYRTTDDWGHPPQGVAWAAVTAVEPAPDGTVYVIHRCFANSCAGRSEAPILKFDASGTLLQSWGEGLFIFPHGATVDREGNLWVADARGAGGKGHRGMRAQLPDGRTRGRTGGRTSGRTGGWWRYSAIAMGIIRCIRRSVRTGG